MRPEGLIAGGCSNTGASERVTCEEGDGSGFCEEENRDDWFISGGRIEAIVGKGGVIDGWSGRGLAGVAKIRFWLGG